MRSAEKRKVDVLEMKYSRSLVGVSRMNRVRNEEVRRRAGIERELASRADESRVSCLMLNPVKRSVHFLDYLNFGVLFNFFIWSVCLKLCNLSSIGYMLVNIELSKFA